MDDVASEEITEDEAIVAARRAANKEIENANLSSTDISNIFNSTSGTPAGGTPAGGTPAGGTPAGGTMAGDNVSTGANEFVQNMLSNMFGPGGRVYDKEVDEEGKIIHSGKSFFETEAGKQFAGERPQGLAGLGVGAPDPMLETFTKLFENAPTAERRKELEDIFAIIQGFTGTQQPRIGPQTLAYQLGMQQPRIGPQALAYQFGGG